MPQKELSDDASRALPRKQVALVLQGGGALGAYQAGVYECLSESPYAPDWVAGISIGAINAAIIAGNPPAERAAKLRMFWEGISETSAGWPNIPGQAIRNLTRQAGSVAALFFGAPGFFRPSAYADLLRGRAPTSFYDTSDLKLTLERLVDFDRINAREVRLSLGAVDVETGNFAYFDNAYMPIRPEHVMASGALPPGFPAVEIEGSRYWDGGLVSNTPLQYVLDTVPRRSTIAFQVDLFPSYGPFPLTMEEVSEREKDIRYSSRTRAGTDAFREKHDLRRKIGLLLEKLPPDLNDDVVVEELRQAACLTTMDVVHLIFRPPTQLGASKDYDFSRASALQRWQEGFADARATLDAAPWQKPAPPELGVRVFDVLRHDTRRSPPILKVQES
jgi:NTE family protein